MVPLCHPSLQFASTLSPTLKRKTWSQCLGFRSCHSCMMDCNFLSTTMSSTLTVFRVSGLLLWRFTHCNRFLCSMRCIFGSLRAYAGFCIISKLIGHRTFGGNSLGQQISLVLWLTQMIFWESQHEHEFNVATRKPLSLASSSSSILLSSRLARPK